MKNRGNKILELLTKDNKIEVSHLAEELGVSQVTMRKDLDTLESKGVIKREHGFALLCSTDDINGRIAYHYEEKRKMFNHDEEKIINNFPSFQDHQSGEIIYIPYLEPFINRYYANDYQLITLKQHQVYLNSYAKTIDKVIELYGIQPYNSQFSSLQLVGQDDESYYFYHDDFKTVYQFNGQNYRIANEINLTDRYTKEYPNLNLIKEAMVKLANSQDDEEILEFLYENKFVGDKTYKKLIKKLKKVSK